MAYLLLVDTISGNYNDFWHIAEEYTKFTSDPVYCGDWARLLLAYTLATAHSGDNMLGIIIIKRAADTATGSNTLGPRTGAGGSWSTRVPGCQQGCHNWSRVTAGAELEQGGVECSDNPSLLGWM
jgi:hypothetical protein